MPHRGQVVSSDLPQCRQNRASSGLPVEQSGHCMFPLTPRGLGSMIRYEDIMNARECQKIGANLRAGLFISFAVPINRLSIRITSFVCSSCGL